VPRRYHGRSAARVLPLLKEHGITVTDAARRTGLTRQMIYLVTSGNAGITAFFMDSMAALFPNLTVDDIFPLIDEPTEVPA
jgi:transcriptional regulator with XRE-family HTH domain